MYEKWIIVGDAQVPFHDPLAIEVAARAIEEINPDHVIYNGDMIDFWSISKHEPRRAEVEQYVSIQEEIDRTILIQDILTRGCKSSCKRHNIDGNHEDRLERFLGTGSQSRLGSLRALHMDGVFSYKKRGFASYHPYQEGIWLTDNLFVYHGIYIGNTPGESVKKEIQSIGASVIMGHTHRVANLRFRQGKSEHRGIENGCLCQLQSSYKAMTNWSHAFTLVKKYDNRHWTAEVYDIISERDTVYCYVGDNKIHIPKSYKNENSSLAVPWRPDTARVYCQPRDEFGRFLSKS